MAAFLNSDIGERLAFRRSTGGTRPALDYQALKTIPVVFKPEIVDIMQSALEQKKQEEVFDRISTGGIMGHISQDALKNTPIPFPPLEIQHKIAEEVKRRISDAERLKAEASKIIEEAKKQVEEMIFE